MRNAFVDTLFECAADDPRVWLVCGDLGYSVLERFAERFPDRFLNAGVAEQNMTGVAAGLAMTGAVPFTYSIANFPVMRCLEQIRNDVCYHDLSVRIVSVGAGLAYGSAGYSHHGVEDIGVLRGLPNMTVLSPADPLETALLTRATLDWAGPCYLRLGKAGEPTLHDPASLPESLRIGEGILMREGADVTLVSTGGILAEVLRAADDLASRGVVARVISLPTVVPLDTELLGQAARETGAIVTVEEHGPGGLASIVAEWLCEHHPGVRLAPVHLRREALHEGGSQAQLRAAHGLTASRIAERAAALCAEARAGSGHRVASR